MRTQHREAARSFAPSVLVNGPAAGSGFAEHTPTVLLVDSVETNRRSLKTMLKGGNYHILECQRASEALEILGRQRVDLVIVDFVLPGMSGPEFCRWLKANRDTQLVPVLMLTSVHEVENEISAISSGADEFLAKPLHAGLVRTRISAMLRTKNLTDALEKAESILFALAHAVEQRDRGTGEHCHRLAVYSVAMGKAAGLSQAELLALYRGGYLHDIGKISVPDAILFKEGALTSSEWEIMRSHTTKGEEICLPMKSLAPVLPIIRNHHERWDGSGYPDGLRGEAIPLLARILQVCDIYDALTNARCYKPALSHEETVEVLHEEVRRGWRDPRLVELFLDVCQGSFAGIMMPATRELSGMLSMHHSIARANLELAG